MATDGPTPKPCDQNLYRYGTVIGIYVTNGANAFEEQIRRVREISGKPVDWHYVGGRAVVKCFAADVSIVKPIMIEICGEPAL